MKHSFTTIIKLGVISLLLFFANGVKAATTVDTDYGFKLSTLTSYSKTTSGAWYQDSVTWTTSTTYIPLQGFATSGSGETSTKSQVQDRTAIFGGRYRPQ